MHYRVLSTGVHLYSYDCIPLFKEVANILKDTRLEIEKYIEPGISTIELDKIAENFIRNRNAIPLFKGYKANPQSVPYPATLCVSNNEHLVHGLPNSKKLKKGDVLSIDLGIKYKNFCSDSARTYHIGHTSHELIDRAKLAFNNAFNQCYVGNTLGDIGYQINTTIYKDKIFKTFNQFTGHGIGRSLHEKPVVSPIGFPKKGFPLLEGMCICIEPIVMYNSSTVIIDKTQGILQFTTDDQKPSAHYENQVFITKDGPINLTIED